MTLQGKVEVCKQKALATLSKRWEKSLPQGSYEVLGVRRSMRKIVRYEFKECIEVNVLVKGNTYTRIHKMLFDAKTLKQTHETPVRIGNDITAKPTYDGEKFYIDP